MKVLSFKDYIIEARDIKVEFEDFPIDLKQTLTNAGYKNKKGNTIHFSRSNLFWVVTDLDPHLGSLELKDLIKNRNFLRILKSDNGIGIKIIFKLQQPKNDDSLVL